MNQSLAGTLAFLALAAAPARASQAQPLGLEAHWDARVAMVTGDVLVRPAEGGEDAAAQDGMPLEEGDEIVVPAAGLAEVALDGGSLMTIRENSVFKIEKTAKGEASFFLQIGSLLAKIQKLGDSSLRVRTPMAVVAVRGTEFGVDVAGGDTHVGVFDEGRVEVSGESGASLALISNQETSVAKGSPPLHAAQLRRFMRHRVLMRNSARRIAAIRAQWKPLPPGERRSLRQSVIERMRAHRLKRMEKRRELLLQRNIDKKRDEQQLKERRNLMENRRKLEERREKIKRRGQRRDGR